MLDWSLDIWSQSLREDLTILAQETDTRPKRPQWLNTRTFILELNTLSISSTLEFSTLCSLHACTEWECQFSLLLPPSISSINGFVRELLLLTKWDFLQLLMISWLITALAWLSLPHSCWFSTDIGWFPAHKSLKTNGNSSKTPNNQWDQITLSILVSTGPLQSCSCAQPQWHCSLSRSFSLSISRNGVSLWQARTSK